MENIVRTVYGAYLQTCQLLDINVDIAPFSTLNEKFNVNENVHHTRENPLSMKYVAIGLGGHKMVLGNNGIYLPEPIQHRPTDGALFKHLPFIIRPSDEDLSASERAKYRIRRQETYGGKSYISYYLKKIDFTNTYAGMNYMTVTDTQTLTQTFSPSTSTLNPTPPVVSNEGVNNGTGDYVSASAIIPFTMDDADVTELKNVCSIIFGDEAYAIISEIALCSGAEANVSTIYNESTLNYTDAVDVQVVAFINTFFSAQFNSNKVDYLFDVGSAEPMIVQ